MTRRYRILSLAAVLLSAAGLPAQQPQTPPQAPPAAPGGGRGGRGGGGRRGGFTQFTRPLASQEVLARGKGLYETNCGSCHAPDLRGSQTGVSLLRSQPSLSDQHGELIGAEVAKHNPRLTLNENDTVAVAEYIHSVLATAGGQGSPPGRNPVGLQLNILVGDAKAGEQYFNKACANCHSVTGDLKGFGAKYPEPRALQNAWVSGASSANPFGGRGAGGAGNPVTVTMPNGQKLEGKLVRKDSFLVVLTLADGTRKAIAVTATFPKSKSRTPTRPTRKWPSPSTTPRTRTCTTSPPTWPP